MDELPGLNGRALFESLFQHLEGGHESTDVIARHVSLWKVSVDACEETCMSHTYKSLLAICRDEHGTCMYLLHHV